MPSIKSPIAKVSLTGTILAVVAAGSFGMYSAGGFTAPGSTAATAATGAEPTQSAQESPSRVPLPRADSGTDHPGSEDGTHRAERLRQGGRTGNR